MKKLWRPETQIMKIHSWFICATFLQACALPAVAPSKVSSEVAASPVTSSRARWGCQSDMASQVSRLWADQGFAYAQQTMKKRLIEQGDTYVLYDLQTQLHNLQAMAVRCQTLGLQRQLSTLMAQAYTKLEPVSPGSKQRRWVCRGGTVCNGVNRLVNTEVMLTSVQFLAFAADVANTLHAQNVVPQDDRVFVYETARIITEHLLRWGNSDALHALQKSMLATRVDVIDGSSRHFLTDKVLWQLSLYAHLAGMVQRDPDLRQDLKISALQWTQLQAHAQTLAEFVERRTIRTTNVVKEGGSTAYSLDLDTGFWRHYQDNRYAAYDGAEKPAVCERDSDGRLRAVIRVHVETLPIRADIGWDLSHGRRLVHYLSAMQRNREAMSSVLQVPFKLLPDHSTLEGFARQVLTRVWNQSSQYPLFANYMSGANGWYRVAYDNGTGRCMEGHPPHGLTDAFATGGYVTWGGALPQLHALGVQLYERTQSTAAVDQAFVQRYYSGLSDTARPNAQMLQHLMFWPTLIWRDRGDYN